MSRGRRGFADRVGAHRPLDVLELLLAQITEGEVELARSVLAYPRRNANATGLGQAFEPRRNVDAVAKDVAILDDDVADVDADPKFDAAVGHIGVAPGHLPGAKQTHGRAVSGSSDRLHVLTWK